MKVYVQTKKKLDAKTIKGAIHLKKQKDDKKFQGRYRKVVLGLPLTTHSKAAIVFYRWLELVSAPVWMGLQRERERGNTAYLSESVFRGPAKESHSETRERLILSG